MASFQERLNEALSISGLTQSELGRRAHIDRTVISGYVHGKYKAKQNNLYNLAKVLNVDEGWLMGVSEKKERRHPEEAQRTNTQKEDITSEDIDHFFNGLRSYKGLPISDEQKAFMRNSIKSFLESQKAMHDKKD
ncbi:helix-turn-helix domain-containing protein [Limosilactobacillus reuteri]|uniref:helix-turn-helix domain-containing protein n=1 Tax=Limosilactobacillus reuteri TaxID=1598 RepID=UPI00214B48D0|nr:helix-turn-helix domain-containing protein [Limosilactobacillus reuteri]MCR1879134.1 helix-turn-helix domain-containing protein [Limosilactobacillus reuteri]